MNDTILAILGSVVVTLLSGGLIGAIATGQATKSAIHKNNADALLTYQKIADIASASELATREREEKTEQRNREIIDKIKTENSSLKSILAEWGTGIKILHEQIKAMDPPNTQPNWSRRLNDIDFLNE